MSNIEHREAAQRERNARALDAEFAERAHAEQAAIIRRLTEESRTLQQQLRGAVDDLRVAVDLLSRSRCTDLGTDDKSWWSAQRKRLAAKWGQ